MEFSSPLVFSWVSPILFLILSYPLGINFISGVIKSGEPETRTFAYVVVHRGIV